MSRRQLPPQPHPHRPSTQDANPHRPNQNPAKSLALRNAEYLNPGVTLTHGKEKELQTPNGVGGAGGGRAGGGHRHVHKRDVLADKRHKAEWLTLPLQPIVARVKRAAADDPVRREIVQTIEKMGAATLSQIVKATGRGWGAVQWHLYVLEREGRLKSVRIGPFTYYFVNPRAAAEVILASASPDSLSLEDREKLDLLASGA
jgi:Predicted transcriptional regulators